MYSESDIEAAVQSGALTPEAAAALRNSVAHSRAAPAVDEESFRLITGFNDIFVSIAAILLLVAVGWIAATIGSSILPHPPQTYGNFGDDVRMMRFFGGTGLFAGAAVAAASWMLAEYFTRRRRMALPSILLLGTFAFSTSAAFGGLFQVVAPATGPRVLEIESAFAALLTAGAAWLHWRRFHVPITIAALTGFLVLTLIAVALAAFPAVQSAWLWFMLAGGLGVFAFAMWWDMSDRTRTTRRADVAFWLHLFAAPMIAHPIFNLLGVLNGKLGPATAVVVLVLYVAFGLIALAIDRRALLVSSLIYVLYALNALFDRFGAVSLNMALTALVIGSALLMLSALWHSVRRAVVERLPMDLQLKLPALDRIAVVTRAL